MVPYQFANTPNGSTIPLAQLDANFQYVENQINSAANVTTFSGGTTGLLPATATSGAITLTGVLAVANGGTGSTTSSGALTNLLPSQTGQNGKFLTTDGNGNLSWATSGSSGVTGVANGGTGLTATPTNGQLLIGNGTGYTLAALTAGTGITIANTAGGITINSSGLGSVGNYGAITVNSVTPGPSSWVLNGGTIVAGSGNLTLPDSGAAGQGVITAASITLNNTAQPFGYVTTSGPGFAFTANNTHLLTQFFENSATVTSFNMYTNSTGPAVKASLVCDTGLNTLTVNTPTASKFVFPNSNGTSGQVLTTDGSGNTSWTTGAGGGIAGANTQVQFNNSGVFGADPNLTYVTGTQTLSVPNANIDTINFVDGGTVQASMSWIANAPVVSGPNVVLNLPNVADGFLVNGGNFVVVNPNIGQTSYFINTDTINPTYRGLIGGFLTDGSPANACFAFYNNPQSSTTVLNSYGQSLLISNNANNNVTIPNTPAAGIFVNGTNYTSDARVKENIVDLTSCLDKVKQLRGVYYNRKEDESKTKKIGFIAQEVQSVIPEVVSQQPNDNHLGIEYTSIIPVLVNAIKELEARVAALEAK
jgi:hypothetical protein